MTMLILILPIGVLNTNDVIYNKFIDNNDAIELDKIITAYTDIIGSIVNSR